MQRWTLKIAFDMPSIAAWTLRAFLSVKVDFRENQFQHRVFREILGKEKYLNREFPKCKNSIEG